ncbi:MAG: hypothetical protein CSA38_00365 [Flavobacteriales bacterium]|nr:MAG: hypothetical protein CSA38_00365 [Flavobacteriales bacterium]
MVAKNSKTVTLNYLNSKIKLFLLLTPLISFGQSDPRAYHHGVCIVNYLDNNNENKYYITWSSAHDNAWEHDIYQSIIHFNADGSYSHEVQCDLFVGGVDGTHEAQEPVNATINRENNYILSVWEDGMGPFAPNVKGRIHKPDGTIIKDNWMIAGGEGAQHSAYTSHLGNKFLIFYADEAPPATGGAVVKCKVIDDETGQETQTISLSPNNEDHWWPVAVSNKDNSLTLVIWGNDGYSVRGCLLHDNNGTIEPISVPQDFIINTQQYYYQVEWLENLSKFIIIARNGSYQDMTDESRVCIINTSGVVEHTATIDGGIIREAKMAVKWNESNQSYSVFYPSGLNHLVQVNINSNNDISTNKIENHPDLIGKEWLPTGTWGELASDLSKNNSFGDDYIILFATNDTTSNCVDLTPIHLNNNTLSTNELKFIKNEITVYSNSLNTYLYVKSKCKIKEIKIYNSVGEIIGFKKGKDLKKIDIKGTPKGVYFLDITYTQKGMSKTISKKVLIK